MIQSAAEQIREEGREQGREEIRREIQITQSAAEQLREEGWEQGWVGVRVEIAAKLYLDGMDLEKIARVTELSRNSFRKLQRKTDENDTH